MSWFASECEFMLTLQHRAENFMELFEEIKRNRPCKQLLVTLFFCQLKNVIILISDVKLIIRHENIMVKRAGNISLLAKLEFG